MTTTGYLWGEYPDGKTRLIMEGSQEAACDAGRDMLASLGQPGMPTRMWVTVSTDGTGRRVWTSEMEREVGWL